MTGRRLVAVLLAALLGAAVLAAPVGARAADDCTASWTGGVGAWSDASRWTPVGVPEQDARVCVVRAPGADPVVVRVGTGTDIGTFAGSLTVRDAAVTIADGTFLSAGSLRTDRARLGGAGDVSGVSAEFHDTRFDGPDTRVAGALRLAGRLVFTGGAGLALGTPASPQVSLFVAAGTTVVDGDGDPGNRLALAGGLLYAADLFVGVRLELGDVGLFAQGRVVLSHLADLAPDGGLDARFGLHRMQLGAFAGGELVLPFGITRIGRGVDLTAGRITTADGADALGSLRRVEGTLRLDRPLSTGALAIPGAVTTTSPLTAPTVGVAGSLTTPGVTGALTCNGRCDLAGAQVGSLVVGPRATVTSAAVRPLTVVGRATLGGTLLVPAPARGRPAVGDTVVLLTAAGGVRGTFAAVTTDRAGRTVAPAYAGTYVTGTFGTPPPS